MKKVFLAGFVAMMAISATAGCKYPSWLEGSWSGIGFQPGDMNSWQADLRVEDGFLDISYPDVGDGCTGEWVLKGKKKKVYHFTENITSGDCDPVVEVYVTRINADAISVAYFIPEIYNSVVAHTVLERD